MLTVVVTVYVVGAQRSADLLRQQDPRGFTLIERGELTVKGSVPPTTLHMVSEFPGTDAGLCCCQDGGRW